jgi:RNA polymerase sigma-70 factor, ECF subfamily
MTWPLSRPDPPEGDPLPAPHPDAAAAFEALFRGHYQGLCSLAYRLLGSRADAEEVVQEVLGRVWDGRARWSTYDVPLERYCYRAVRNEAINRLRRRRRETAWYRRAAAESGEKTAIGSLLHTYSADQRVVDEEMLAAVARAVDTLPQRCRLIFELKWSRGLRYAEIAELLGIAEKTVENQLLKAIKLIRLALGNALDA